MVKYERYKNVHIFFILIITFQQKLCKRNFRVVFLVFLHANQVNN